MAQDILDPPEFPSSSKTRKEDRPRADIPTLPDRARKTVMPDAPSRREFSGIYARMREWR